MIQDELRAWNEWLRQGDRAEAERAIFDLWQLASTWQAEPALRFSTLVTHGAARRPSDDEVRGWIKSALLGGLAPSPPTMIPWYERLIRWWSER